MRNIIPVLLAGAALALPATAQAQPVDMAAIQRQMEQMQAEIARLTAEVAELRAQEAEPAPEPIPVPSPAPAPSLAPAPAVSAAPASAIAWRGAPEITAEGGWSFKPRGRLQIDSGVINAPSAITDTGLGWAREFRRAYLGVDGTLPGGFGYRIEADFADGVTLTDVYMNYRASDDVTLVLGQQKAFWGLDELTSDLFTPFMERAAFNSAFGFERRVGLSATYSGNDVLVQAGVFSDDFDALRDDSNNSYSVDGRVVFSPEVGEGRLHLGVSAHLRDLNDAAPGVRYRTRPFLHTTDVRFVDTGAFSATGERSFGAELAYLQGPFHATIEGHSLTAIRAALPNPTFWGGYAEIGMLLTPGDKAAYRGGTFDRTRPANPLNKGGIGAIQLSARYDYLDLADQTINGGKQQVAGLSLIWMPTDYVRFLVNYGHLWISDAAIAAGVDRDYQSDAFGMRAQFDF